MSYICRLGGGAFRRRDPGVWLWGRVHEDTDGRARSKEGIRPSCEQRVAVLHRPHVLVRSSGQAKQQQLGEPHRMLPACAHPSAKERAARVSDIRSPAVRISSPSPDDVEQVTGTPWSFVRVLSAPKDDEVEGRNKDGRLQEVGRVQATRAR